MPDPRTRIWQALHHAHGAHRENAHLLATLAREQLALETDRLRLTLAAHNEPGHWLSAAGMAPGVMVRIER